MKYDELLEFERTRRTELEQTNTAATAALKAELRNLYTTMEKDITNAREERHQLEKSHRYAFTIEGTSLLTRYREQLQKLEEANRIEKKRYDEEFHLMRSSFAKREQLLLSEKVK